MDRRSLVFVSGILLVSTMNLSGCGSTSGGGSTGFQAPTLVPVVNSALPATLQQGKATPNSAVTYRPFLLGDMTQLFDSGIHSLAVTNSGSATVAAQYIQNLFADSYANINGGSNVVGYVLSLIQNVDARMSGINTQTAGGNGSHTCLSATAKPFTIDLSSIDPMFKFTLNQIQCISPFSGNITGSGIVFGSAPATTGTGTNYSLWLSLGGIGSGTYAALGGFMLFANVNNYGSTAIATPATVSGMMIAFNPSGPQINFVRFLANQTAGTFELAYAGNQANIGGIGTPNGDVLLGAGFRMISNGNTSTANIYSDGLSCPNGGGNCGSGTNWSAYTACISASTLGLDTTPSDCNTLATSFTFATTQPTATGATGNAGLNACEATGGVAGQGCTMTGSVAVSLQTPASNAVATALATVFPVTTASPTATTF